MLKRLLTAVLILTLFMVFTGTAFSAPKNVPGGNDVRDIVKAAQAPSAKEKAPALKTVANPEPVAAATLLSQRPHHGSANSADTMSCGEADYFSPAATFFVSFARRSNSAGTREFAMRFDGPPALPNYKVKIDGTENWIYRIAEGGAVDGVANIKVTVYNDNAGLPGTVAYSEVFAAPVHGNSFTYTYFPFTNPPLVTGAYHISYKVDASSPSTDTVVFTSDDAGFSGGTGVSSHRSHLESAATPGVWYTSPVILAGVTDDLDFSQTSVYCNIYSSCYTAATPSNGFVGLWKVPDPIWASGSTFYGLGQRFVSTGPDTVKSVDFQHYDRSGSAPGVYYTPTSTNGIIVKIWGDDGTGNVDYSSGPLATETVVGGVASLFPTTGLLANGWNHIVIPFATPPVVIGPWHVTVEMTSTNLADGALWFPMNSLGSDPGRVGGSVAFTAPDPLWNRTGTSPSWTGDGLGEMAFFVHVNLCSDEFSSCQHQVAYDGTLNAGFGFGYAAALFSRRGVATQIISGLGGGPNRVEKIGFNVSDDAIFGDPGGLNGTPGLKVYVAADGGPAGPGSYIWSTDLTYADLTPTINGWTEVVIPGGVIVANNFYVGFEILPVDSTTDYFYHLADRVIAGSHDMPPHVFVNGGMWQLRNNAVANFWQNRHAASGDYANAGFEVDFCSVPPSEWPCGPVDNFATTLHDQGRTGHSNVPLSDAYCDLTVKWGYQDAQFGTINGAMGSAAPIVWNNFVVCMFGTKYVILDATTGALLKTFVGSGAPDFITATGSLNCTPTIANITIAGTPTNVLFIAGGSVPSVSAYNMDDPGFAQIWSINSTTLAAHGFPGALGNNSYANFVVLKIAGVDKLFFATGGPRLYSVDAATGNLAWGPYTLDGAPLRGMATDGANLFISTTALPPSNPDGDVYSINAATGAVNWQLSAAGGLKGQIIFGAANATGETFPNGVAFSDGELYTMSGFANVINNPADGAFYRINATTGAVLSAVAGQCVFQGSGAINQGACLVDAATITVLSRSGWVVPPLGQQVLVYNRFTGAFLQGMASGDAPAGTYYNFLSDGAMSCDVGAPDWTVAANVTGYISFFQSGTERFNRRLDFTTITSRGAGVAIGADQSVYVGAYAGAVYKLTKQADRPRLEIVNYFPTATTYGPLPSVLVNFGKVFTNTGCGVLTGTITIDDASNGSTLGAPGQPNLDQPSEQAATIADQLTYGSLASFVKAVQATDDQSSFVASAERVTNRAAAALPSFINPASATVAFSVNAGDSASLILDVKQNAVNRGPNVCYGWFTSNDPDFFINNTAAKPQVKITIVGGCLIDTTDLAFGAGAANVQKVTNTGRLGTGDWTPHAFKIDGNVDDFYQGAYLYGVSAHRIALSSQDWWSGGGEVEAWISMQADPNSCTTDCKPALVTGVTLGQISSNGLAYTNLTGNVVCRTFLDSVQNFGTTLANWNWILYSNALFDADSTMGLMVNSRVIGFVNVAAPYDYLNNATIDIMKIWQRYGLPLNNWKMSLVTDYDMGGDSAVFHPEISAGWAVPTSRAAGTWGVVKLPYGGCGLTTYAPLKNVKALAREQSVGTTKSQGTVHGNGWLDSAYTWMSQPSGLTSQGAVSAAGDQDFFATIIEHSFTANDTLQYALVEFGFPTMANPLLASNITPLASTLNKWVGFNRGDVNNDGAINLADIVYLAKFVNVGGSPGPIPFKHCGDVDGSGGAPNTLDVNYLINYYFYYGPCPVGQFIAY